jgi:hypothetical protein
VRGTQLYGFYVNRAKVLKACRKMRSRPVQAYFVNVNGRLFPPKQVIQAVLPKSRRRRVGSVSARRALGELGFKIGTTLYLQQPYKLKDNPWIKAAQHGWKTRRHLRVVRGGRR